MLRYHWYAKRLPACWETTHMLGDHPHVKRPQAYEETTHVKRPLLLRDHIYVKRSFACQETTHMLGNHQHIKRPPTCEKITHMLKRPLACEETAHVHKTTGIWRDHSHVKRTPMCEEISHVKRSAQHMLIKRKPTCEEISHVKRPATCWLLRKPTCQEVTTHMFCWFEACAKERGSFLVWSPSFAMYLSLCTIHPLRMMQTIHPRFAVWLVWWLYTLLPHLGISHTGNFRTLSLEKVSYGRGLLFLLLFFVVFVFTLY